MASTTPSRIPALDAYSDLEDIQNAAEALGLMVTTFLDNELVPLDALYKDPVACRLVLARHEDVYAALKVSHVSRDFAVVRGQARMESMARAPSPDEVFDLFDVLRIPRQEVGGTSTVSWGTPPPSSLADEEALSLMDEDRDMAISSTALTPEQFDDLERAIFGTSDDPGELSDID